MELTKYLLEALLFSRLSVKAKFLRFCLSYLLSSNYWGTQHRISILIKSSKVLCNKGKLSGGNSYGNTAYLSRTKFRVYLFLRASKNCILQVLIFANDKFLKI